MESHKTKPTKKLLDQVREIIRSKHYSPKTEKTYVSWIKRYILYHNKKHPGEMNDLTGFILNLGGSLMRFINVLLFVCLMGGVSAAQELEVYEDHKASGTTGVQALKNNDSIVLDVEDFLDL